MIANKMYSLTHFNVLDIIKKKLFVFVTESIFRKFLNVWNLFLFI